VTGEAACLLCGAKHAACGQAAPVNPVDIPREEPRTVGELKKYRVTVNGNETVLKLTEADAKRYEDAELVDAPSKARKPQNKARTVQNKKADDDGGSADAK
jgi:hypothetical protein